MEALSMILGLIGMLAVPAGIGIWIYRAVKKAGKNWIGWGTVLVGLVTFIIGVSLQPPLNVAETLSMVLVFLGILAVPVGTGIWIYRAVKKAGKDWIGWGMATAGLVFLIVGASINLSEEAYRSAPAPEATTSYPTNTPEAIATYKPTDAVTPTETAEPTDTPSPPSPTATRTPVPSTPTSTPIPLIDIAPQEVKRVNVDGTEYQWEQLKQKMIGKRIVWHGEVSEVTEDRSLRIHFPGTAIYIDAGTVSEERAAVLVKGQPVTIEARVLDVSRFLGSADLEVQILQLEY